MDSLKQIGPFVGRILMALLFLFSGFGKITAFDGTAAYIAARGLPAPQLLTLAALVVELGGSLMLIAGWKARWGAAGLFLFTAVAALLFHDFWAAAAGQAQNQMIHFVKNIAICGGLLYVIAYGSGPLSVDRDDKQ